LNAAFSVLLWVFGLVTTTSTIPLPPGVVTLIEFAVLLLTVAGTPPNVTVRPETKLIPVIVTVSPPLGEPVLGETKFILGAVETGVAV
jgi:hypothetical protein